MNSSQLLPLSDLKRACLANRTFPPSLPAAPGRPCSPGGPGDPGCPLSPTGPVSPVEPFQIQTGFLM